MTTGSVCLRGQFEFDENVFDSLDEFGPVPKEGMGPLAVLGSYLARHGEYFSALVDGLAGRDKRAARERGFDDDRAEA